MREFRLRHPKYPYLSVLMDPAKMLFADFNGEYVTTNEDHARFILDHNPDIQLVGEANHPEPPEEDEALFETEKAAGGEPINTVPQVRTGRRGIKRRVNLSE